MSAVAGVMRSLADHWDFACAITARDLRGLNKGSLLGVGWLVVRPLIHVAVYVVIVSYVFKAKVAPGAGPFDYALYVLSGLIAWQALQRALEEAPSLIPDRMEILKQVIYPIETLPVSAALASSLGPAISLVIYLALAGSSGHLTWSVVLLPIPLISLAALVLGLSWTFMIVGVVVKDLREVVSVLFGLLVYVSPVVLSEEMVGQTIWSYVLLNPLSHVVVCFRDVLQGGWHQTSWVVFVSMSLVSFAIGAWTVSKAKIAINEYI